MNNIPIIYFHSVADTTNQNWKRSFLTLGVNQFEEFLIYLKKKRWKTIFLDEYYSLLKSGKKSMPKVCCLTFDDGFLDNYIFCYPLLKKYGFNATLFISPEFIDPSRPISKTLEDVWGGNISRQEINSWGYLSWPEMEIMQKSNVFDFQSHTLTHTKYFTSDELVSLHHPGDDCLYPIGNLFPNRKPTHINDIDFESLLPYGTPFFKETSSVIAKRVFINENFNDLIISVLSDFNWNSTKALSKAYSAIRTIYKKWLSADLIIYDKESESEYLNRIKNEIILSKTLIEDKLQKDVEFLCWPHGDNNELSHSLAIESGYLMTTIGKSNTNCLNDNTRIPERMGINFSSLNKKYKTIFKLKALSEIAPYSKILNTYRNAKSGNYSINQSNII